MGVACVTGICDHGCGWCVTVVGVLYVYIMYMCLFYCSCDYLVDSAFVDLNPVFAEFFTKDGWWVAQLVGGSTGGWVYWWVGLTVGGSNGGRV